MKDTKTMGEVIAKPEGSTMTYESEWAVEEEDFCDSVEPKAEKKLTAKYYLLRDHWVENTVEDMESDPDTFMTLEAAMKGAAKKAVKNTSGVIYVAQIISKVEQTNYEQMVKASPITETNKLIEGNK